MKKATELLKILTANYTKPISKKYAKVVLQVATLEERLSTFSLLGMKKRVKELNKKLSSVLIDVKKEFNDERNL